MLQLVVKDLTTGKDVLVSILLTEPGVNFERPRLVVT
jgi:hypothetical protein